MPKYAARPHQIEDLAFYMNNPRCANTSDPGTGKTLSVCLYIQFLWQEYGCRSYWVMPKSLLRKNRQELLDCTDLKPSDIVIVDGTPKERAIQMGNKAVVYLMGFKRFADDWQTLHNLHPDLNAVMVDEIHMGFKTHDSQRTKALNKCMRFCKYFVAMSGSLIDGRLDSCYPTINIIEPRYYANYWSFRAQHAILDDNGQVLSWTNHEKIGRILIRHAIRRTFASVHGKEAKVIQLQIVPMHPKQRKDYDKFEEAAILELEDGYLEGFNPAVNAMRCRQIMAHPQTFGLLKDDELTGKEEAMEVIIDDHIRKKEPLLIYATLQPEQERIYELCKKAGLRTGLINGNVSAEMRGQIDEQFQRGELDCVVASPATAAVGFNWGHVNHVVFMSLDYQNVNFIQAYRRAIRGKRDKPLLITVLKYEDCRVENRIHEVVERKSNDLSRVDETYEPIKFSTNERN